MLIEITYLDDTTGGHNMSHTTTISTLLLSDDKAIISAIAELQSKGVNCELLRNVTPRSYPGTHMEKAPMVLKLNDASYDVGFYESDDGKSFKAATDFYNGGVERALGAIPGKDDDRTQARLGKFYRTYAAHAATRKASQQGYSVRRTDKADGSIQLVVTG